MSIVVISERCSHTLFIFDNGASIAEFSVKTQECGSWIYPVGGLVQCAIHVHWMNESLPKNTSQWKKKEKEIKRTETKKRNREFLQKKEILNRVFRINQRYFEEICKCKLTCAKITLTLKNQLLPLTSMWSQFKLIYKVFRCVWFRN